MNSQLEPTLCFPDGEKSCFACCPPIRPHGYEHIQHKNAIQRMLRENTSAFAERKAGLSPITGFSCWALGYLDKHCNLVGCLLHPAQNEGKDLRFSVDYGDKCRRENCPEAEIFLELDVNERKFWLHLADGLDSFAYSSKRINPVFKMMGWGPRLLGLISLNEDGRLFTKESFFRAYAFFSTRLNPRAYAYLLNQLVCENRVDMLKTDSFRERFERFSRRLSGRLKQISSPVSGAQYTHRLGLDPHFLDFLRLSVGISRIEQEEALRLKERVDRAIGEFATI
ncbi:MAG: hypothetical protein JRJ21_10755 [Deltaproteobacteria bacterium]|nr:hypothetical protein [Deltaproteobacteria bacterium]